MPLSGAQSPLRILFVFLDGVGLGPDNPDTNPFAALTLSNFNLLGGDQAWTESAKSIQTENHVFSQIDATLGMPGLPQSGTGQATLFTGKNCAEIAGKHFGPFPHSKTKPTISESNIFRQVTQLNLTHPEPAAFGNAYPPQFFEAAKAKNRWTVTTLSCMEAEIKVRTLHELNSNKALTADLTRRAWRTHLSIPVDLIDEQTAGIHLTDISNSHPFTLYEYYLTDKAGHSQSFAKAKHILTSLDQFLGALISHINFDHTLLLITSDHGNLEDLSVKTHTYNPVPLIAYGNGAQHFANATSLLDITPGIISALSVNTNASG